MKKSKQIFLNRSFNPQVKRNNLIDKKSRDVNVKSNTSKKIFING